MPKQAFLGLAPPPQTNSPNALVATPQTLSFHITTIKLSNNHGTHAKSCNHSRTVDDRVRNILISDNYLKNKPSWYDCSHSPSSSSTVTSCSSYSIITPCSSLYTVTPCSSSSSMIVHLPALPLPPPHRTAL